MASPPTRNPLFAPLKMLAVLFVAGWLIRSFLFGVYAIPSQSMLPQLRPGDVLLVAKWPYGWSRYGLIGGTPLFRGRWNPAMPERGDVVLAGDGHRTVVKRVMALPGDRIAMVDGAVELDGHLLPRLRIGDLVLPATGDGDCRGIGETPEGCRYRRYTETLPDGRAQGVLDSGTTLLDRMAERAVPADHLFLMGDNRDDSSDSRVAPEDGGLGMVPADHLLGRATVLIWSTDGTARLASPQSWWRAVRWDRIGLAIA